MSAEQPLVHLPSTLFAKAFVDILARATIPLIALPSSVRNFPQIAELLTICVLCILT